MVAWATKACPETASGGLGQNLPSEDQTQDPHILRAIGRAWGWRRRMEAGEFGTVRDLAIAVGLAERHVSRQLRLAHLAP